ncbi:MAG: hypothetical protein QXH86_01330 [Ignisphaera sp.]
MKADSKTCNGQANKHIEQYIALKCGEVEQYSAYNDEGYRLEKYDNQRGV